MKLKGMRITELGRLERKLEKATRDTEEAVAQEQMKLKKLRQDWCRVKLRLRRLEYKESLKKPVFSE